MYHHLESPWPFKNAHYPKIEGVVTPFSRGHGDSRYCIFSRGLEQMADGGLSEPRAPLKRNRKG